MSDIAFTGEKKYNNLIKILKMVSFSSPPLKNPEFIKMQIHKFNCWTQDASYITVKLFCTLSSLCSGGFKFPHYTYVCWILDQDWLPTILWCDKSCWKVCLLTPDFQQAQRTFTLKAIPVKTAFYLCTLCSNILFYCFAWRGTLRPKLLCDVHQNKWWVIYSSLIIH